jgi:hypothetical protein
VNISGYDRLFPEDLEVAARVYDAWDAASGGEFWAAHLLRQGYDEEAVLGGFGVDEQATRALFEQLVDSQRWPAFEVPMGDGRTLTAVYRNFDEDTGVDYLLGNGEAQAIRLAAVEGTFQGPGLSWSELRALLELDGPVPSHLRLLMFLPAAGEHDMADEAQPLVTDALRRVGAGGDLDELAEALTEDHPMWDLPGWVPDAQGNLICDGPYSPRNPKSPFYLGTPVALPAIG